MSKQDLPDDVLARDRPKLVLLGRHPAIVTDDEIFTRRQRNALNCPGRPVSHVRLLERDPIGVHDTGIDPDSLIGLGNPMTRLM